MIKYITITFTCFILLACNQQTKRSNSSDQLADTTGMEDGKDKYIVAFYNVENLFDTERDKNINDEEFTPYSDKNWTEDKYQKKLNNIAYVINEIAKENKEESLAIMGLAEVENKKVLSDLVSNKQIAPIGYQIIHHNSPDPRGIDVALLYNPNLFKLKSSKIYPFKHPKYSYYDTRDILLVSGAIAGEAVHIIVNHWVSRKSQYGVEHRDMAAKICKNISDSIYKANPKAKIIIMGDLNDNPDDRSCRVILKAKRKVEEVQKGGLLNPMWNIYRSGQGSCSYQGRWDLFDQIIVSESLLSKNSKLKFSKASIFNKAFLIQKNGRYKGLPLRTYSGNKFMNGYSDHFPSYILLKKEKQ